MSKARKIFQMGILSGGGLSFPYTFDATTAADGALPAYFAGATFAVLELKKSLPMGNNICSMGYEIDNNS